MKRKIIISIFCLFTIFLTACTVERPNSPINQFETNPSKYCLVENLNELCKEWFEGGLSYFSTATEHFQCEDKHQEEKPKKGYYKIEKSDYECK